MDTLTKPGLNNGQRFKAVYQRRWIKQLEDSGSEKYTKNIEDDLAEEAQQDETDGQERNCSSNCRRNGRHLLHSKHVLRTNVALCIIDCIMVMVELILDNTAVREDIVLRYGVGGETCIQAKNHSTGGRHKRAASSDYGSTSPYATIAHYCHYVSVAILIFLTLETLVKLFCLGRRFFRSKLEVFDAFVVISSLILDCVFLEGVTSKPPLESSSLVNILLPWRIIRVVNSLIIATRDHEHFKLLLVFKSKKQTEDELFICQRMLLLAKERNTQLMTACNSTGIGSNYQAQDLPDQSQEKACIPPIYSISSDPSDVKVDFQGNNINDGLTDTDGDLSKDSPMTHL